MMLDVADIDELVFQLGHLIPTEATVRAFEIQRVHGVINHPIAEIPVLEHLRFRVRLTAGAVAFAAALFPQPKCSFVLLEIQVREEQRVKRQLPERNSCGRCSTTPPAGTARWLRGASPATRDTGSSTRIEASDGCRSSASIVH
jgi:hypothetical protein